MIRSVRARIRAGMVALLVSLTLATVAGTALVAGVTGLERSDVVLVFDVSNSILLSTDGTNVEFADALDGIADRVQVVATDLAGGNAQISFVVFGRTAIPYPANCARLDLHNNPIAITRFEQCLRSIAAEYRAGAKAPVRQRVNTQDTDHVAALVEAANLLPTRSTRSAVIFFTDGEHDPPGTARDKENVVAKVTPAFNGRTPLAVLPVGLGSRAGVFESELRSIYTAFFRDMQPCEGRASFSWPQVVFPSPDAAGTAVALALQEVTCSFTVAPTPMPSVLATQPPPSAAPPTGVRVLAGDGFLTIQWLPPTTGAAGVTGYVARCHDASGSQLIEPAEGVSTTLEAKVTGLQPGVAYQCEVAAMLGTTVGPWSAPSEQVVVLGIPNALSQPRVETLDAAARLSADPPAGRIPVDQYVYECTNTAGQTVRAAGSTPTVVVTGLTNGQTFQCIGYAENSIGRSPPSPASASFSPCGGLFDCNPWMKWALGGVVLAALLGAVAVFMRRQKRRNRVWITAQVDGGENRPLGWGPELGIRLTEDDAGWFAAPLPAEGAKVHARYRGENRFVVTAGTHVVDVHQGDSTLVRDDSGALHQLTLRRYADRPSDRKAVSDRKAASARKAARIGPDTAEAPDLGARLGVRDDNAPSGSGHPDE